MPIKANHAQSGGSRDWRRICKALQASGIRVGKQRVQALMQLHGTSVKGKGKQRFRVTTDSNPTLPISPSLLNREFTVSVPERVWAGGITCIATDERWPFLAIVIDLFSRHVVGWSLQETMPRGIVIDALRMDWFKRRPSKASRLIFHSD